MIPNLQEAADLVTLTKEILNGKLHLLWLVLFSNMLILLYDVHGAPLVRSLILGKIITFTYLAPSYVTMKCSQRKEELWSHFGSSCLELFVERAVLKIFMKNRPWWHPFLVELKRCNFMKSEVRRSRFPINFVIFLK